MKIIRKLRSVLFRVQQKLLYSMIKTQIIGPDTKDFNIDPDKPVIYAMLYPSHAEQLVIDREASLKGWASPQDDRAERRLPGKPWFSIYHRAAFFRKQGTPMVASQLVRQTQWLLEDDERDIQIVPVRVFWGRAPQKEGSFLRIWLQNTGAIGGRLAKLMAIVLNGRNTFVHFSRPISLREMAESGQNAEKLARKVARVLRVHNRQVSAAVLGPDLSHRRTLVHQIPNRPLVVKAIEEEAQSKGISKLKAQQKALKYADEIASNISYTNVRFLDLVLTWVWNKIYDGIALHNIENLKDVIKDNEIIYVPCHRSHIDYLLLSYVLYHQGLQLPQIAAGINLNMPVVGSILRRGGAFFMRRTFRDNKLYAAVFDEYLHSVFAGGYATEYFVEGGRSRTGRTLSPKAGMLAMTLRSYLRDSRKPILFMPVYTGYEKVFEANSYLGELRGQKKKKESLLGVLGTLRSLKRSFGKVNVTFGDPVYLTEFLDQQQPDWKEQDYSDSDYRPQWAPEVVGQLANQVVTGINNATSVNPVNLIALSILSAPRQAMEEEQLISQMESYHRLLASNPYSHLTSLPDGDGQSWLEYGEKLDVVSRSQHPLGDLIQTNERQAVTLTYYRNNVLHLIALPSLLACLFTNNQRAGLTQTQDIVTLLYPYLKAELFLRWDEAELAEEVKQWLTVLVEHGYLLHNSRGYYAPPASSYEFAMLQGLAGNMMQTLERYFLTLSILSQKGSGELDATSLEEQSTLLAQRISLLYGINAPEFFDKNLFRTLIRQLISEQRLAKATDDKLIFDDGLQPLIASLEEILDGALRESILRSLGADSDDKEPDTEDTANDDAEADETEATPAQKPGAEEADEKKQD
ncbi:MAG: glycerol-3-phosphate 1-O-acyltransferase [Oceanospirillaceae bacterium]|uniref:glycerol-3-phosphate 1-O-acyltransferase PlsB n=1 Tax=unclassified Thalassolituus TaxID=2624967 RepID=UPI000C513887|nr:MULTISPECIES: glycerol-3-phosphate 1-O-acyltransferase PlsB [unclassified Thalassolituus]MAS24934.1 glycerol-3-phosphate 1-O-acyltransferase [Oceanospirillaceae bacterium]MBL35145.1 glycerol-3-phosphate 1-O-acyltransferase [Oceanospirillaceae bacterium]MBS52324.1 glycerol-3-phosphate 1-O-acyltransferase [Oceanospirillaceae bacterium]|tara:strand:+ start:1094 stop:3673 length:2580 start_codon:yes stop_codon:yes gene_type:complete